MKLIALLLCVCEGMLTLKDGYDNLQWNKRLEGRFLTIIPRVSPLDCAEECIVRTGCLSFNYLRSAIFCELNYASDLIEDEVLTDSVGWVYGRREHWSMLMTDRCLNSSCTQVEKCIESLDNHGCTWSQCHPSTLNLRPNVELSKSNMSLDFGNTHTVVCAEGSVPSSGDGNVQCLWNASWTTVNLKCRSTCTGTKRNIENREYCFMREHLSWSLAKEQCYLLGANLLEIDTLQENLQISQQLESLQRVFWPIDLWWTGGSDNGQEGIWRWNFSGRYFTDNYNSWQAGEPDGGTRENCLLTSLSAYWQDEPCANSYGYVCERQLGL